MTHRWHLPDPGPLTRYGYLNTSSAAGRGVSHTFNRDDVLYITAWTNGYGNPSYGFHFANGDTLLTIDDYGALNDLSAVPVQRVGRRKDLV